LSRAHPISFWSKASPSERRGARWCLAGVNQCWTQKAPKISAAELSEAKRAYDHAREVYQSLIEQSKIE